MGSCSVAGAGVGKTRRAQACLERHRGWAGTSLHATATEALAGIPLGALAVVLDLDASDDELALAQQAVRALQTQARAGPIVLAVDDAHLLDGVSAGVLSLLADVDGVALVLTVRAGAPMPREVERSGPPGGSSGWTSKPWIETRSSGSSAAGWTVPWQSQRPPSCGA